MACRACVRRLELAALSRTVALAEILGVHRRDVYRVRTKRAGGRVSLRVLEAMATKIPEYLDDESCMG